MTYLLLTGSTGLLGRYLLRDLTLAEMPLAVIVRPSKWESAAQRIETAMAKWEADLGRSLVRPVVLEGEISEAGLGLNSRDLAWIEAHCSAVLHSAASLSFHTDQASGEPWRSNVEGTLNVLQMCGHAKIRRFHHVSSAYVCGLRRGQILESDLNLGQAFGNDYEQTKLLAETEAVGCGDLDQVTVYRPSIIVGDSQSGFTTSYHGFYTPLRIVYSLLQAVPWESLLQGDFLGRLQLSGDETKNMVAVDWVSAVIAHLVSHPNLHGRTYHLTNPVPTTAMSMQDAIAEALAEFVRSRQPPRGSNTAREDFVASFREQMGIYEAYWKDDPRFDSTRTQRSAPHLPCPAIDHAVMQRLVRFAIRANFGWPRETPIVAEHDLAATFSPLLADEEIAQPRAVAAKLINVHASGRGGGQWHLTVEGGRPIQAGRGLTPDASATCYLTSPILSALVRRELSVTETIEAGRLVVVGNAMHPRELAQMFRKLGEVNVSRRLEKATNG